MTLEEFNGTPEANRCPKCREVNQRKRLVQCGECTLWFHLSCVGLTQAQAVAINVWNCHNCLGQDAAQPDAAAQPPGPEDLALYVARLKSSVRILARVPKGARIAVGEAYTTLLHQARVEPTPYTWARLLAFPFAALATPAKTIKDPTQPSLATKVKQQVGEYMAAAGLLEPPQVRADKPRRQGEGGGEHLLRRRVAAKFADGDVRGAVRALASEDTIADFDETTARALREKHPSSPADLQLPAHPDEQLPLPNAVTKEEVMAGIRSFPQSSAAGPDGLRPSHLRDLVGRGSAAAGDLLLTELTAFVNLALQGKVPDFALPIFYGASLIALNKKGGGIRPIAVGNTIRRLAAKVGLRPLTEALGEELRPVQLGFGTPGGCEAAVHATRRYLKCTRERRVILKLDMRNAFNTIRRDTFLTEARERIPTLYPLLWQAYAKPTALLFGDTIIPSATGLQQGDPVGPALFSLGVDSVSRNIKSELNVWFLDDATVGGPIDDVLADLTTITAELARRGLEINDAKCELVLINHHGEDIPRTSDQFRGVLPNVRVLGEEDQVLLGAPLSAAAIAPALRSKRDALKIMASRLVHIDPHSALVLLKNCFAVPRLQYILRTSAAFNNLEDLREIDTTIREAVSTIVNVRFDEPSWKQAVLPVSLGGLGVRRSEDIALPSFISSMYSTSSLVDSILSNSTGLEPTNELVEAINIWRNRSGEEPEGLAKKKQKSWDRISAKQDLEDQVRAANQVDAARLAAAARHESGLWLHAIPIPSLGTHLDAETIRIAVAQRVGAPVCEPHRCRCGSNMDALGHHALSCRVSAGRFPRHSAINDVVKRALHGAGLPSILEPVGLDRGDGKRPDGMTIFPYANGRSLVWDATCVDTFAPTNIIRSALEPSSAAEGAEEAKRRKYRALAERHRFEPFAFETTCVFGPSTISIVNDLGRRLKAETGEPRETLWLKQRLGMAVLRGNAACVLASSHHHRGEEASVTRTVL